MPRRLLDMLDTIDHLHADAGLDVRHADRFQQRCFDWWPAISRRAKKLLGAEARPPDEAPAYVAGITSYLGTLEHLRAIGRAASEDFRLSNRDGVFFHLSRNRLSRAPAEDYRLAIGFTGDDITDPPGHG